ncbi:ABC transporter permease [Alicyclobacillus cycloheptanicus]|uniref:ABC-type transport system involved in multi-copper enzyme maturation permease subunit n=2 Tax=Alicyclobacillus cycloheptanicus TaxID=1457 RepID=A0ABT9XE83_9BACL|nr:ABC transporter permease subunit [Alicyclobacillus cycloheptanicus]MDQ0188609.1 ABC-type transport system involved in multi-copper enzyme maturation permease subunit [Alicyclobacillus cycloheptanicus]
MRTNRAPVVITAYIVCMALLTFFLLYENVQGQLLALPLLPVRSEQVFVTLSLLQMTVVAFMTPAFAAGSMSGERERRTLAVLLTTPLSPVRILMGKILSSSALLSLLLVSALPLYSMVFLFGGAVPQEVVSVFAFQIFTIVLIATLSVLWSTIALRSGWSTVLAYATVAWMVMVTGALGYGLHLVAERDQMEFFAARWSEYFLALNPLWIESSFENYVTAPRFAWVWFVGFYSLLSVILFIPSVWRLRPQTFRKLPWIGRRSERDFQ